MKKYLFSILSVGVAGLGFAALSPDAPEGTSVNVTQHHNNPSRDGLYIDPAFTTAAAANLTRDLSFSGTIVGNVYSQPLYVEGGPSGPVVIAVTESNNVYALNATTGAVITTGAGDPFPPDIDEPVETLVVASDADVARALRDALAA